MATSVLDEARSTRSVAAAAEFVRESLAATGTADSYAVEALGGWCFSRVADPPRAWSPGE